MSEWNHAQLQGYINSWPTVDASDSLVADGVTDDTSALQTLIDNNPKRRILLPAGTILLESKITLKTYTALIGHGSGTTLLHGNDGIDSVSFEIGSAWKILLQNITFDGNNLGYVCLVASTPTHRIIVNGCTFENYLRRAVRIAKDSENVLLTRNTLRDILGAEGTVTGFGASYTRSLIISHNTFTNIGNAGGDWAIYNSAEHSLGRAREQDVNIYSNTINAYGGIKCFVGNVGQHCRIYNNDITTTVNQAIVLGNLEYVECYGNTTNVPVASHAVQAVCKTIYIHDETIHVDNEIDLSHYAINLSEAFGDIRIEDCVITRPAGTNYGHAIYIKDNDINSSILIRRVTTQYYLQAVRQQANSTGLFKITIEDCNFEGPGVFGNAIYFIEIDNLIMRRCAIHNFSSFINIEGVSKMAVVNMLIHNNTINEFCGRWGRLVNTSNSVVEDNVSNSVNMPDGNIVENWLSTAGSENLLLSNNMVF